jgi:hypothetical protein
MSLRLLPLVALAALGASLIFASAAYGDMPAMARDAHNELEQALNVGGPTPSDADRTTHLKAALEDLKSLPPDRTYRGRYMASSYIKSALYEISHGGLPNQIESDIRDADSLIRDMDS